MKKHRFLVFVLSILLTACQADNSPIATSTPIETATNTPPPLVVPDEITEWLQANAVPFDTAEPGHGCDDLQPLMKMIGEARIVALGEATHGTHEFFTMKQRIIECLVAEKNFNIVAMELAWPIAGQINNYVMKGSGDIELILDTTPMLKNAEMINIVEWIHQYNNDPYNTSKISFHGFDIYLADITFQNLENYIKTVDPKSINEILSKFHCYQKYVLSTKNNYSKTTREIQAECQAGLQGIADYLAVNQANYIAKTSIDEYSEAVQNVRLLEQYERVMAATTSFEAQELRDQYMAENVTWFLDQAGPNTKMVLWAHNVHVQTVPMNIYGVAAIVPESDWEKYTYPTMGMHLREEYKNDLFIIGLSFNNGKYIAHLYDNDKDPYGDLDAYAAAPLLTNSHETYLSRVDLPYYILNLQNTLMDTSIMDWFSTPRWLRCNSIFYNPKDVSWDFEWIVLPQAFDVFIFFQNTTPSSLR